MILGVTEGSLAGELRIILAERIDMTTFGSRSALILGGRVVKRLKRACCVLTAGEAALTAAVATAHSLRHAWWTSDGWHFETLDGPGSTLSGRTGNQVGATVAVTDY